MEDALQVCLIDTDTKSVLRATPSALNAHFRRSFSFSHGMHAKATCEGAVANSVVNVKVDVE
eukprot:6489767-Amphidinium_carterae.1